MEEIEKRIINLSNFIDNAKWELSDAEDELNNLEEILKNQNNNSIKDIDNLKRELKRDGLYSEKLEEFLENYMKYYNK